MSGMNVTFSTPPSPPDTEASLASPSKPGDTYTLTTMSSIPTPSTSTSPQGKPAPSAIRRARSPPRNSDGEIICDHQDCEGKDEVIFRRLCEWNKHMDRHERPYKCSEAGCELVPGFTYSGGLLRHQREVHKMHQSMKNPLFCPFPNCNRSSGTGFTRKENLEEHKRRRHLDEMSQVTPTTPMLPTVVPIQRSSSSRKRKRLSTPHSAVGDDDGSSGIEAVADIANNETQSSIIKRLRMENHQLNECIVRQRQEIHHLQQQFHHVRTLLANVPFQAYNINMGANAMHPQPSLTPPGMMYSSTQDHARAGIGGNDAGGTQQLT